MGIRNSVKSRKQQKNPDCLIAGCNYHSAHLAASKGGNAYHKKTGFDIEEHQVDLYYFFKKSTRRKGILANYTELVGCEKWEEITGYVSTRWLSLEQCWNLEIKRFEALKSMLLTEDEKDSTKRFKRLSNDFADPLIEVHVAFSTVALPIFTNYNKLLQRNDLLPHEVLSMTKSLACKIAGRFILRDKLQSDITFNLIENEDNYVSLKDVFLGLMTKSKLNDLLENGDISEVQYQKFIVVAIEFYKVSLKYVLEKMNVEALFWKHAVWVDFEGRANAN